jgi:hypothetical protein
VALNQEYKTSHVALVAAASRLSGSSSESKSDGSICSIEASSPATEVDG